MNITHLETFMANAGLRNYLFVRLHTSTGLTGLGEASLEWQEKTVETLLHEWAADRIIGCDPFDIERIIGNMIRDQYQGGATIMTAISSLEVALWDIVGKACGQPVYKLLGGRYHSHLPAYANGWYGGAANPHEYAELAKEAVAKGYNALKFDPFGVAWKEIHPYEGELAIELVAKIREAVGPEIGLIIEYHGRLTASAAIDMMRQLEKYHPLWSEEPVAPEAVELLRDVKRRVRGRISSGERLYNQIDFFRLIKQRSVDIVQMDVSHCGGIMAAKKIAAMAAPQDIMVAPHCSIGPVALAAALHFDVSTPNFLVQEAFAEFDVPWRNDLVKGWNPLRNGSFFLSEAPGLGLELDEAAIAAHPYIQQPFPCLWDRDWMTNFKQDGIKNK
jgi:galactonate dehydratase